MANTVPPVLFTSTPTIVPQIQFIVLPLSTLPAATTINTSTAVPVSLC
jgi:hypothetical protein